MSNKFLELLEEMNKTMKEKGFRKEVMNIEELSNYTGYSKSYLYRLCSQRLIPYYKPLNKTLFFKRSEIDRWIFENPVPTFKQIHQNHLKN